MSFRRWLFELELPDTDDTPAGQMLTQAQKQLNVNVNQAFAQDPKTIQKVIKGTPADKTQALADVASKAIKTTSNNPALSGQKGTNVGSVVKTVGHQLNKMQPKAPGQTGNTTQT